LARIAWCTSRAAPVAVFTRAGANRAVMSGFGGLALVSAASSVPSGENAMSPPWPRKP